MLAQRFIAMCDRDGCKAKCRVTVIFKIAQPIVGVQQPLSLQPMDLKKLPDGWSWGWDGTKTAIGCPDHKVRK